MLLYVICWVVPYVVSIDDCCFSGRVPPPLSNFSLSPGAFHPSSSPSPSERSDRVVWGGLDWVVVLVSWLAAGLCADGSAPQLRGSGLLSVHRTGRCNTATVTPLAALSASEALPPRLKSGFRITRRGSSFTAHTCCGFIVAAMDWNDS